MAEKPFENRLINQKSPYLLKHAHNLVDWYPWGEEAFEAARELDKPIFLSIGYATCHFCHVMIRESFAKAEIASLMNETFINVKVDREELPEIDSLYMEFAEALMATGTGWPLNLILTPALKPFYATTYLPPSTKQELMGLKELAEHIQELWKSDERELLFDQAEKLVDLFSKSVLTRGEELPSETHLNNALEEIYESFDPIYGGAQGTPKYPMSYHTQFFMQHALLKQDARSLFCAELTLKQMHRGGLFDHVGGGFSRYSNDEKWEIPHFEKILYDNALLAGAYLDAFSVTKKTHYKEIVESTCNYLIREMQHQDGGFYSAQDASETDDEEGSYYTWAIDEIQKLLTEEDFSLFCDFFCVTQAGNFNGRNALHQSMDLEEFASLHHLDVKNLEFRIKTCLQTLFDARLKRTLPFTDDKILVSWNAMLISVLVRSGLAFQEPLYLEQGVKAAHFIKKHFWSDGKLMRRFREGHIAYEASLDDYAYLIQALITLFESGQGIEWFEWALEMTSLLEREFKADEGAFYQTSSEHSILLRRPELFDGSQPSGNAIHTENLLKLAELTSDREFVIQAEDILKVATHTIETYPQGAFYHLMNVMRYLDKIAFTVVIALDEKETLKEELMTFFASLSLPHITFVWKPFSHPSFGSLFPHLEELTPVHQKTTVYVVKQGKIEAPLTSFEAVQSLFT